VARVVRDCPECGAAFSQHRWEPAEESFLIGDDHATLVQGKRMTVRCRNGHRFRVVQWHRHRHKGHTYELGERL
jgi:hypothetical protein